MSSTLYEINTLLRQQDFTTENNPAEIVLHYARSLAAIEKAIVVVSDLKLGTSRIFHGAFSDKLGLNGNTLESSIWEKEIFSRIPSDDLDKKYLAELRFYNYIRRIPRSRRANYYLLTRLRMTDNDDCFIDVWHRMYYWYENKSDTVRYGICIYTPSVLSLPSDSIAVNALTGTWEELTSNNDSNILSAREKQVLSLIEQGLTSRSIAEQLCISKNTVSRHRQQILFKLQAKNSTEACRRAKQLRILN